MLRGISIINLLETRPARTYISHADQEYWKTNPERNATRDLELMLAKTPMQ